MWHCNTLQHTQHAATRCNTLQHTATHCNTLQHTATHCNTLQHTATHCNAGTAYVATNHARWEHHRDIATCCNNTLQHAATHCNTHCNTLQHTATQAQLMSQQIVQDESIAAMVTSDTGRRQVAVCCSVLQIVAALCSALHYCTVCCKCCSVLQCVVVCCSVLQCVVVCCSVLTPDTVRRQIEISHCSAIKIHLSVITMDLTYQNVSLVARSWTSCPPFSNSSSRQLWNLQGGSQSAVCAEAGQGVALVVNRKRVLVVQAITSIVTRIDLHYRRRDQALEEMGVPCLCHSLLPVGRAHNCYYEYHHRRAWQALFPCQVV